MDNVYQYETNEDILFAKYIFHQEPVSVSERRDDHRLIEFRCSSIWKRKIRYSTVKLMKHLQC